MRRRFALALAIALPFCAPAACSRRDAAAPPPEPPRGDAVWFTEATGAGDAGIEETLGRFRCAAVYLPVRRLERSGDAWAGRDLPAPAQPLARVPVMLVVEAPEDPLIGADEKAGTAFGAVLAREVTAALARETQVGSVRGVHLDVPFSGASAEAHGAALREARSRLSHLLARKIAGMPEGARRLPLSLSLHTPAPTEEEELKAVRALASRSDGLVAFVFGDGGGTDGAFADSLGKPWWAAYLSATQGAFSSTSSGAGASVPEGTLDALTDDPRIDFRHGLPWDSGAGAGFTLRATRPLRVPGASLSAGDSIEFVQPSLPDLLARLRADAAGRRFARGRIVVFGGDADADRLFPVAALADILAGGRPVPQLRGWADAEGARLVRVGADNSTPHASVASRIQNWIEVDLSPARVEDVELGGFERWEAYDEEGRLVSPGRAARVRLYETLVAPHERLEPARLRVKGRLPAACCRMRTHLVPAAGGEVATEWAIPEARSENGKRETGSGGGQAP